MSSIVWKRRVRSRAIARWITASSSTGSSGRVARNGIGRSVMIAWRIAPKAAPVNGRRRSPCGTGRRRASRCRSGHRPGVPPPPRRHVMRGSEQGSGLGQRTRRRLAGRREAAGWEQELRDAEVGDFGRSGAVEQHVVGLDVAMKHAAGVRVSQALRELHSDAQDVVHRHPVPADALAQVAAVQQLHDEAGAPLVEEALVDRGDVRVVELAGAATSISARRRAVSSSSIEGRMNLIATGRPPSSSRARYTIPMPPAPRTPTNSYWPIRCPTRSRMVLPEGGLYGLRQNKARETRQRVFPGPSETGGAGALPVEGPDRSGSRGRSRRTVTAGGGLDPTQVCAGRPVQPARKPGLPAGSRQAS